MNAIFRAGSPPRAPLDGEYGGELVALDVAPGVTQLARAITRAWMPWRGKTFDERRARGDNIFMRDSLALARVYWPLYRGYVFEGKDRYHAFDFRTRVAPGLFDPDRAVLKIDYDLASNPRFSIRRVLDELVQVRDDLYLGKAHVKWWWGKWQTVAYFTLRPPRGEVQ
ncbi:MAG: hypothetical protein HY868_07400 [Chloroflexi bacterium]|nr:hypothetical protein [Chloroflexota bacterium]